MSQQTPGLPQPTPPPPPSGPSSPPAWATPPGGPASSTTSGFAVASFVFGILGGIPLAVTFGVIALRRTGRGGQRGRGVAIAGLSLAGCWVLLLGFGLWAAVTDDGPRSVSLASLGVGDCIEGLPADGDVVHGLPRVSCDVPHTGQVYAAFDLPDGAWPGADAVFTSAEVGCSEALDRESPELFADPDVGVFFVHPIELSWRRGDRKVLCVTDYGTQPRTGDLRASTT